MLRSTNIMGTVIGTRREMQALKSGKATCVLKPRFTDIKPWVRYVALHAGVALRGSGWRDELVARLRTTKRGGGCVLGPFTSAEALWDASQDGMCFKLGIPFKQLQYLMKQKLVLYVYRFYPAEVCPKLVWTDLPSTGVNEWDGFVRCRNARGKGVRFYVTNEVRASVCKPEFLSRAQWAVLQAKRRTTALPQAGGTTGVPQYNPEAGGMTGVAQYNPEAGGTTGVPQYNPEVVQATAVPVDALMMARHTQEAAREFLNICRAAGASITVLIALEGVAEALEGIGQGIRANSARWLVGGLYDLQGALGEYGWAMSMTGAEPVHVQQVRVLCLTVDRVRQGIEATMAGYM